MSIKTGRKIGLFASLAMLLGTVIGIGIFLKNHSVLRSNDWSGIGTLVSWVLGGLLSLGAAVSFSEISSFKTKIVDGPPGWAEKVGGKYLGYFIRFNYGIFYFVILNVAISLFAAETVVGIFYPANNLHFGVIVIIGIIILFLFVAMNYVSVTSAGIVQKISTVIKFMPLIAVVFGGIIMAATNEHPGQIVDGKPIFGHNAFSNGRPFDFTKMLAALPAVLFAYDSFLITTQLRHKMKNPNKLPFIVLFGMISIIVLYSLIALSAILHGSGLLTGAFFGVSPSGGIGIFDQIMPANIAKFMGTLMLIVISISTLGVVNGVSAGSVAMIEQIVVTDTLFGIKSLKKKAKEKTTPIILTILLTMGFLVIGIPAIILNSDGYVDAISNFPTLFMFAFYGLIIFLYTIKRKQQKTKKINNILFYSMAFIAILGIFFVVGYQFFYGMTVSLLLDPNGDSHAGLFMPGKRSTPNNIAFLNKELAILFFATFVIFVALPFINYALIKYFEKRDPIKATEIS